MNSNNQKFIRSIIEEIRKEDPSYESHRHFSWVVIGGYATNSQNPSSDLDLLYFYEGNGVFSRFKKVINGIEVSLCTAPAAMLETDGSERRFGGYFSAKCLNPHHFFNPDSYIINRVFKSAGEFMAPLASYPASLTGKKTFSAEELAALMIVVFSSMRSGYFSYFLSYFVLDNFIEIWRQLADDTARAFLASGVITNSDRNRYSFIASKSLKNFKDYHLKRLEADSRHWSFASYTHSGDYTFQDTFYDNARNKTRRLDSDGTKSANAEKFLCEISGLDSIYV
jgi:hypothetical protein